MAELKTKPTEVTVADYIAAVEPASKREDAKVLDALFRKVTGEAPRMWGPSIVGYGEYHYKYASGHEGDMCRAGFSPRTAKHSLYLMSCDDDGDRAAFEALLARFGKHAQSKACIYVNKLADVDLGVLEEMIVLSWRHMAERYPA